MHLFLSLFALLVPLLGSNLRMQYHCRQQIGLIAYSAYLISKSAPDRPVNSVINSTGKCSINHRSKTIHSTYHSNQPGTHLTAECTGTTCTE